MPTSQMSVNRDNGAVVGQIPHDVEKPTSQMSVNRDNGA